MRKWMMMGVWCFAVTVSAQNTFFRIHAESVDSVIQQYVPDSLKNARKEIKKWVLSQKVDEADERTYNKFKEKQEELMQGNLRFDSLTLENNRRISTPQNDLESEIKRLDEDILHAKNHIAELQQQISESSSDLVLAQQFVNSNKVQNPLKDLLEEAKQQMADTFDENKNQMLVSQILELKKTTPKNDIPRDCDAIVNALKNQIEYAKTLNAIKKWLLVNANGNKTVKDDIGNKITRKIQRERQQDPFPAYYVKMNAVLKKYRNLKTGDEVPEDEF